jgi:hypothetical protein
MKLLKALAIAVLLAAVAILEGCAFVTGAAIGGTAGYMLKDRGYEVQSPVTKETK